MEPLTQKFKSVADCQTDGEVNSSPEELKEYWEARIAHGYPPKEEDRAYIEGIIGCPLNTAVGGQ